MLLLVMVYNLSAKHYFNEVSLLSDGPIKAWASTGTVNKGTAQ